LSKLTTFFKLFWWVISCLGKPT